ncbi:MAG TPA: hypothetical protein VKS78_02195 [Roseiarcus sp.]|nr:hypothetical protein [Roseiarcus sp.]
MDEAARARWRFLYRQSEGAIGPAEWIRASLPPAAVVVALTLIWIAIMPREEREPTQGLIDFKIMAIYAYLMIYAFALLIWAVAQYFVSAKRFADRGEPPALAGVAPFALFLAGAANWYEPRSEGLAPHWLVLMIDAIAFAAVIWNIVELGFLEGTRGRD